MLFLALTVAAATDSVPSPWLLGGGTVGLIGLLALLAFRVLKLGSDQMLLASKQAQVLVGPLEKQVANLTAAVTACEEASLSERVWYQILVARLEHIIRSNDLPIPEETWVRPR